MERLYNKKIFISICFYTNHFFSSDFYGADNLKEFGLRESYAEQLFKGQQAGYYAEAMHKRIISRGILLSPKLRIADRDSENIKYIKIDTVEGFYELLTLHKGKILKLLVRNSF